MKFPVDLFYVQRPWISGRWLPLRRRFNQRSLRADGRTLRPVPRHPSVMKRILIFITHVIEYHVLSSSWHQIIFKEFHPFSQINFSLVGRLDTQIFDPIRRIRRANGSRLYAIGRPVALFPSSRRRGHQPIRRHRSPEIQRPIAAERHCLD